MPRSRLILIGGGCRSGKSDFALRLARTLGPRRAFLATAQVGDDEMRARIERHRRTRGSDFSTIEEALAVPQVIGRQAACDVLVVDCLTLWLANLLLAGRSEEEVLGSVAELTATLADGPRQLIVVTNEVGMGIVPETALGRTFRDVAGKAHQRLSRAAAEVYFAVLGTILQIKPRLTSVGDLDT